VTTTDSRRDTSRRTATAADHNTAPLGLDVTRDFAKFLAGFTFDQLPQRALEESRRGLLDWIGCALAGSPHPTIGKLLTVLQAISATRQATVIGRNLKLGPTEAALANGQMSHVLDYDDTHMGGVVLHASAPILCALFPLLERGGFTGRDLICAYVAGFEAGVRIGQSAPGHHGGGWHLTGTLGTFAAGAAAGRLLGLAPQQLTYALGIAATQAAGMQQNRGTMCKSFHAGKSASNGLLAALLAQQGFDSSDEIIEGKRGFCRVYSNTAAPELVLDQIGQRWEITRNGHKPYACGVVLHPAIDAMIALAGKSAHAPGEIDRVELRVHPFAVSITGAADPKTGLQSKFSIYHAAAVAYLDRNAGIPQFSDQRAAAPDAVALRGKIVVATDETFRKDQAEATLVVAGSGERITAAIAHASGTVENPMTDKAIEDKFLANAIPVIGPDRARQIAAMVWQLEALVDARELVALCG
jgi:2-methylcitrate dehydratase PrpD